MKSMIVTSAILQNAKDEFFVVQRPESKIHPLYWEFPGGKLEAGEIPEKGLSREIREEINLQINPQDLVPFNFCTHQYDFAHITLLSFRCRRWTGEIKLKEGQPNYKWVPLRDLSSFQFPTGNSQVLRALGAL